MKFGYSTQGPSSEKIVKVKIKFWGEFTDSQEGYRVFERRMLLRLLNLRVDILVKGIVRAVEM